MQNYRCKCGECWAYTSMGVSPCARCSKCGSDLAQGPTLHQEPKPHHVMAFPVETDDGKGTLSRCWWCQKKLSQIEKRGEPFVLATERP